METPGYEAKSFSDTCRCVIPGNLASFLFRKAFYGQFVPYSYQFFLWLNYKLGDSGRMCFGAILKKDEVLLGVSRKETFMCWAEM